MTKSILLLLLLLSVGSVMMGQNDSEFDVKAVVKEIEKSVEQCPRREVVATFERKHHKQVWQKQAWGPPSDVFGDVKANDSILYPYVVTVEFSLSHAFGPERPNKADAERD